VIVASWNVHLQFPVAVRHGGGWRTNKTVMFQCATVGSSADCIRRISDVIATDSAAASLSRSQSLAACSTRVVGGTTDARTDEGLQDRA